MHVKFHCKNVCIEPTYLWSVWSLVNFWNRSYRKQVPQRSCWEKQSPILAEWRRAWSIFLYSRHCKVRKWLQRWKRDYTHGKVVVAKWELVKVFEWCRLRKERWRRWGRSSNRCSYHKPIVQDPDTRPAGENEGLAKRIWASVINSGGFWQSGRLDGATTLQVHQGLSIVVNISDPTIWQWSEVSVPCRLSKCVDVQHRSFNRVMIWKHGNINNTQERGRPWNLDSVFRGICCSS